MLIKLIMPSISHFFLWGVTSIRQNFMMEEFSSSDEMSFTSILVSLGGDSSGSDKQILSTKCMSASKNNK